MKYIICWGGVMAFFFAQAQSLNTFESEIVLIESFEEKGTGYITGFSGDSLFITTARHVIAEPDDVRVFFNSEKNTSIAGVLVAEIGSFDLAIIGVSRTKEKTQPTQKTELGLAQNLRPRNPIQFIGHPGENTWRFNPLNAVDQVPKGVSPFFTTTSQGVRPGCSGAPIWNECNQWIGLILETNGLETRCLAAERILEGVDVRYVNHINTASNRDCLPNEEAKSEVMNDFNTTMDLFISRSRDLSDQLKLGREKFFYGKRAVAEAALAIEKYNEVYETVNSKRNVWIANVKRFWQTSDLEGDMRRLMMETLDRFHKTEVLPYGTLLERINTYNQAPLFKRGKKKNIQSELDILVDRIENQLNAIETEKTRIALRMQLSD